MPESIGIRTADLLTLILYFGIIIVIGLWCSMRLKNTEGYFVGGRKMPGWAVGVSMLGTAISSVTFLAYPGNAFDKDWRMLVPGLMIPFAVILAAFIFVPFYRRARLVSVYEYLERRFGTWARIYGCLMWSLHSFFRMGIILFLLSLPISSMTGFNLYGVILVMGLLVTIYTVVGGIEAVIWTDVLQTVVLILGGIFCIVIVFTDLPNGSTTVFSEGAANNKFNLSVNFSFTFAAETIYVLALFGLFQNLQEFVSDQTRIQRYCAPSSDRGAKFAIWLGGLGCIPVWALFMFVGTCMWVFYQHFPEEAVRQMKPDQVFPHFILTQLPLGFAGFVIAAVIAAAMSSIDSSMNGTATVLTSDLYRRHIQPGKGDRHYLFVARLITGIAGTGMILWALMLTRIEESILPIAFAIYAILAGGLGGLFFIGIFTKRANSQGALIGIVCAILVTLWMTVSELANNPDLIGTTFFQTILPDPVQSPFHRLMINVLSNMAAFLVGYFASWFFAPPTFEQLDDLTIWTVPEQDQSADPVTQ